MYVCQCGSLIPLKTDLINVPLLHIVILVPSISHFNKYLFYFRMKINLNLEKQKYSSEPVKWPIWKN